MGINTKPFRVIEIGIYRNKNLKYHLSNIIMKILHVCGAFYPCFESGGVVRVVYDISRELVKKGHEVTVYTTDGCSKRLNVRGNYPVDVEGIKTYYFRNISNKLRWKCKLYSPYYLPFVAKKQIKNFDVIHIHEHRTLLAIMAVHYARKYNIPYVLQAHGSVLPFFQKQKFKKIFDLFFGFKILKGAHKLIALTETEKEQYKQMGVSENKITILPNGINLEDYKVLPKKGGFRKKYKLKKNEKIILYVGRLHKNKGIDILINSFFKLSKKLTDVKLVLVGPDSGYKQELEGLIENLKITDKILFLGFVSQKEKLSAFIDADVFVTPCFSGFPITFLESCVCGTPIITTKKGDKLNWIKKVGFIGEYNQDSLCEAIYKIIKDGRLRKKFGDEGKRLVKENFNWGKIFKELDIIYG